jgi:hypothetical protein
MKTVNQLVAERNNIDAQIFAIENRMASEAEILLMEEIANLIDGVGEGFTSGDYYAPDRYYSKVLGVKNLRLREHQCEAKVVFYAPLPEKVVVRGMEFKISTVASKNYDAQLAY